MTASRVQRTLTVGVLTALLLSGCGLFGGDDPEPTASGSGSATSGGGDEPSGPTPEELSQEVLDQARAQEEAPAIGSGSADITGTQVTVDVVSVQRADDATTVTMRVSGSEGVNIGVGEFRDLMYTGVNSARTLYLVDPGGSGTRYLPLQFDDYREMCLCPVFPLELGPEPQTVTAVYPPLPPETTTVDLVVNDTSLSITGLPVEG